MPYVPPPADCIELIPCTLRSLLKELLSSSSSPTSPVVLMSRIRKVGIVDSVGDRSPSAFAKNASSLAIPSRTQSLSVVRQNRSTSERASAPGKCSLGRLKCSNSITRGLLSSAGLSSTFCVVSRASESDSLNISTPGSFRPCFSPPALSGKYHSAICSPLLLKCQTPTV